MAFFSGPVLAAVDGSPGDAATLAEACRMAAAASAPVVACHVLPELYRIRTLAPALHGEDETRFLELEEQVRNLIEQEVSSLVELPPEGIAIRIESGTVHSALLAVAEEIGAGLIVLGTTDTEERSRQRAIVRSAGCPVLVVRNPHPGPVLVATDFSRQAEHAVRVATEEASRRQAALEVFHAVDVFENALPPAVGMAPVPVVDPTALREAAEQELAAVSRSLGPDARVRLVEGDAGMSIVAEARKIDAQLVVVATHGRSGVARLVLGSVAEAVIEASHCSVLVVRTRA